MFNKPAFQVLASLPMKKQKLKENQLNPARGWHLIFFLCLLLLFSLAQTGCGKQEVQLDRETIKAIDTLAAREIKMIGEEMDSLCKEQFNSLVFRALDSILVEWEMEIEQLTKK